MVTYLIGVQHKKACKLQILKTALYCFSGEDEKRTTFLAEGGVGIHEVHEEFCSKEYYFLMYFKLLAV